MAFIQDPAITDVFSDDALVFSDTTQDTSVPERTAASNPTSSLQQAPSEASAQVGTGPDSLVLQVTQNAYQGDAQYAVYVDGKQVGGTFTAKALHNSGQADRLEIKGDWGEGSHSVSVQLLNDLYGGSPDKDRNLYVESATYNGATVPASDLYVNSSAAKSFTVTGTPTAPEADTPSADEQPTDPPPAQSGKLTKATGAIKSSHDGQVIENLDLYVDSGNAITVTHDDVIVRNVRVHHKSGDGILVMDARNVQILNSEIINADPPQGQAPETSGAIVNIEVARSPGLKIQNVTVRDGSTGIHLWESPGTQISHVDGYNFHGPFPRGQFVQFNRSGDSTLTDFYISNDKGNSHPEDNVSVYASPNVRVSNGVIDGNNSVSGVGIMFEAGSTGGRVTNVDAIHMGNGAFSSYADNVVFDDTRSFDSIWGDQGRGMSASNGVQWGIAANGIHVLNSTYTDPGNPGNIAWDRSRAATLDLKEDPGAVPMAHVTNHFDWIV